MPAQTHKVAILAGALRGIGIPCDGAWADEHVLFEAWIAARNTHAADAAPASAPENHTRNPTARKESS